MAPPAARLAQTVRSVRAYTLTQLEQRFGAALPPGLLDKAPKTRDRVYTQARTFWGSASTRAPPAGRWSASFRPC